MRRRSKTSSSPIFSRKASLREPRADGAQPQRRTTSRHRGRKRRRKSACFKERSWMRRTSFLMLGPAALALHARARAQDDVDPATAPPLVRLCACCSVKATHGRASGPEASPSTGSSTAERSSAPPTARSLTSSTSKDIFTASFRAKCPRRWPPRRARERSPFAPALTFCSAATRAVRTISFRPNSISFTTASQAKRRRHCRR